MFLIEIPLFVLLVCVIGLLLDLRFVIKRRAVEQEISFQSRLVPIENTLIDIFNKLERLESGTIEERSRIEAIPNEIMTLCSQLSQNQSNQELQIIASWIGSLQTMIKELGEGMVSSHQISNLKADLEKSNKQLQDILILCDDLRNMASVASQGAAMDRVKLQVCVNDLFAKIEPLEVQNLALQNKLDGIDKTVSTELAKRHIISPWQGIQFDIALKMEGGTLDRLKLNSSQNELKQLASRLADVAPDIAVAVASATDISMRSGQLMITFSEKSQRLLEAGKLVLQKDGLPFLVSDQSGVLNREFGRVVTSSTSTIIGNTANIGSGVVSIAHVISGIDNAKKLKQIQKSTNLLLKLHGNELTAWLEADFIRAQRILANPINEADIRELKQLAGNLTRVRSQLCADFGSRIEQISDRTGFSSFMASWIGVTSMGDDPIKQELLTGNEQLALIRFTLLFQLSLEQSLGTMDNFISIQAANEHSRVKRLSEAFGQKLSQLSSNGRTSDILDLRDNLENTVLFLSKFEKSSVPEDFCLTVDDTQES